MSRLALGVAAAGTSVLCCAACVIVAAAPSLENLIDAAKRGDSTSVHAQLVQGVAPNGVDAGGCTALMYAAIQGHGECVKALLAAGATAGQADSNGVTALMLAASRGHASVCTQLLQAGGSATTTATSGPYSGMTPLDIAIEEFRGDPAAAEAIHSWAEAHPTAGAIMKADPLARELDELLEEEDGTKKSGWDSGTAEVAMVDVVMGDRPADKSGMI